MEPPKVDPKEGVLRTLEPVDEELLPKEGAPKAGAAAVVVEGAGLDPPWNFLSPVYAYFLLSVCG